MIKIIDVVPVSNTRKNPQSFINRVEKQENSITLITGYGTIYAPVIKRIAEAHLTTIERNWHVAIKDSWEDENVGLRQWFVVWSNGKNQLLLITTNSFQIFIEMEFKSSLIMNKIQPAFVLSRTKK